MAEVIIVKGSRHVVNDCRTCGVVFTIPERVFNSQQKAGGFHYCPNGHQQGWTKQQSETERLRRERDRLAQQIAQKDDEIHAEVKRRQEVERTLAASQGREKKMRNRAKAGVCTVPGCKRHFVNLERHMASKHSDLVS